MTVNLNIATHTDSVSYGIPVWFKLVKEMVKNLLIEMMFANSDHSNTV